MSYPAQLRASVRASAAMGPFTGSFVAVPLDVLDWYTRLPADARRLIDRWITNTTGVVAPEYGLSRRYAIQAAALAPAVPSAPLPWCTRCGTTLTDPDGGPCLVCADAGR